MAIIDRSQAEEASGPLHRPCRVERIVATIQGIYAGILLVCLALGLLLASTVPSRFSIGQWACIAFGLGTGALTYLGLRFRKPWVVSLIVFSSAYAVIPCAAGHQETVLAVIISRIGAIFALYQLWFFTRPDTGRLFGTNGTTVF